MHFIAQSKKNIFFFFSIFTITISADQHILLKNIYHHRGVPQCNSLELGTVVFYFSAKPVIKKVKSECISNSIKKNTYTIAGVRLHKEKMDALPIKSKQYGLTMHMVGDLLHLVITYNRHRVAIECTTFDSISLQKGVAVHFLDCMARRAGNAFAYVLPSQSYGGHSKTSSDMITGKQKTIVIDCGHGGNDAGAVGCFGVKEKDITLAVGLRLAQLLKKAGMHVLLTRSSDIDVPLDERTSFANRHNADLFISIHANYAQNSSAQGIDTFCINAPLLHRDNSLSEGTCGNILFDLVKLRAHESNRCARAVHGSLITNVKNKYPTVVDRKIKHEIAQILLGSHMPAILIELGFVSHEQEANRLRSQEYQDLLAWSIRDGVVTYMGE